MRLISQDNNYSINFDSHIIWKQDKYIYADTGKCNSVVLGVYDSQEQAELVFEEIHDTYRDSKHVKNYGSFVYNMPKAEELK